MIGESYERIHRSGLIDIGMLPLQLVVCENAESPGLSGEETFEITGLEGRETLAATVRVQVTDT